MSYQTIDADQVFYYTCLGTETATFTLTLPRAMTSLNYQATAIQAYSAGGFNYQMLAAPASFTLTTIVVKSVGATPTAGDVWAVSVRRLQ